MRHTGNVNNNILRLLCLLLFAVMINTSCKGDDPVPESGIPEEPEVPAEPDPGPGIPDVIPAFPGAEGFGAMVTGGRGGKVLYVTRLDDDTGEGSLRWAVNQSGKRTILFKVAGIITLKSTLEIKNGDLTIAGQSAPGDGICIRNYPVVVKAGNIIVRYMRFRMGDETQQENDAFWGRNQENIIIDHCSISWSTDECASFYDNTNFTLQWCILSESLVNSVHAKGSHGYGAIWGGRGASFHHNLLAHHDSRNPRMCGSRYSAQAGLELVDFRNNVIYNWGSNSAYAGEGGNYNFIGNYYKSTSYSSNKNRIFQPNADDGKNNQAAGIWGVFYVAGNYVSNSPSVTADNWQGIQPNPSSKDKAGLKADTGFQVAAVTTHTAQEAYEVVLEHAGASRRRDATDKRVIDEVRNGLAPLRAGNGTQKGGLIDSQSDVGGWDNYSFQPDDVPADTDLDGIPDDWETANGLNPDDASDGQSASIHGQYTNLEVYLNGLVNK